MAGRGSDRNGRPEGRCEAKVMINDNQPPQLHLGICMDALMPVKKKSFFLAAISGPCHTGMALQVNFFLVNMAQNNFGLNRIMPKY